MAFNKDWRPENWPQIKANIINTVPVTFSAATGYSKADKDLIIEKTAEVILGQLAAVIVTE